MEAQTAYWTLKTENDTVVKREKQSSEGVAAGAKRSPFISSSLLLRAIGLPSPNRTVTEDNFAPTPTHATEHFVYENIPILQKGA